jgi:dsDNA-binding SOS-regulon protein
VTSKRTGSELKLYLEEKDVDKWKKKLNNDDLNRQLDWHRNIEIEHRGPKMSSVDSVDSVPPKSSMKNKSERMEQLKMAIRRNKDKMPALAARQSGWSLHPMISP